MNNETEREPTALTVASFSKDGFGVARYTPPDGGSYPVELPFTMPGDEVLVDLNRRRRGKYFGKLLQIAQPAPGRQEPRCVHFGQCGGCRWQHLPYAQQLSLKQQAVERAFEALIQPDTRLLPIVPCDNPWGYRNKMEFSFSSDSKGERYLGLMLQSGRSRVFHLTECHLVDPWMAQAVIAVRQWWHASTVEAYHPYRNTGTLRTLTLRHGQRSGDRLAMLTVSGNPDFAISKAALKGFVECLRTAIAPAEPAHLTVLLRIQQIAKKRQTQFYEMMLEGPDYIREELHVAASANTPARSLHFHIGPTAFFQPNPGQAEKLYSQALQLVTLSPDALVYDLCCGTGALGIAASPFVKQVIGIELSPESALDARANVIANGCANMQILAGDVGKVLTDLHSSSEARPPDLVIVDPPRSGLTPEAIQQLLKLAPAQILYISCNPTTQAADIAKLLPEAYRLVALQAVDQFPQTVHIENIAVLQRVLP